MYSFQYYVKEDVTVKGVNVDLTAYRKKWEQSILSQLQNLGTGWWDGDNQNMLL